MSTKLHNNNMDKQAPKGPVAQDPRAMIIKKLFEKMKANRDNWDNHWRDLLFYILPRKEDVHTWKTLAKGEEKHDKLYDASAIHFAELLASALHSMLTNPTTQWFGLSFGDEEIDNLPEVKVYVQKLVRKIHNLLNNSNFHSQMHEIYLDLSAIGTAILRCDEDDDDIFNFLSKPIYTAFVKENAKSVVDTLGTEDMMTVRQAFALYGQDAFGTSKEAGKLAEKPDEEIAILHLVMPKGDMKINHLGESKFKFASFHVWLEGCVILKEGGFKEFPYMVPRWSKNTGEAYGRGPGDKALPDVKMLNSMSKTTIRGAQKIVDPTLLVDNDSIMGRVNTRPGGLIGVRGGTKDKIEPLLTGGQPGVGLEIQEVTRARIKEHFFIDQLQLRQGPQMTAEETRVRDSDRIRLFSPVVGRSHTELLKPLIARVIGIMIRKNKLPAGVPDVIKDLVPQAFFTSALAQAQKIAEAENVNRFMESIGPIAALAPKEVKALFDPEEFVRFNGRQFNIPEIIFAKPKDLKESKAAMAAEEAKSAAQTDAMVNAEVANKAGIKVQGE